MIFAGFALLAVGGADIVRQFVPRRWIGFVALALALLLIGSISDALVPMAAGMLVGAAWVWSMPEERPSRLAFWPAIVLGVVSIGAVVWGGDRTDTGLIGDVWRLDSPFGAIPFDLALLVLGVVVFLLESANLVVRAALDGEHTWRPLDAAPAAPTDGDAPPMPEGADSGVPDASPRSGFKGGRLIGPLERVIVFLLTLAGAYAVLAAVLAAKGIVRFPEISRDGETGARAEYFLVGSLVSWVIALGAAFLVWWSVHT